jgi:ATP-dependent Clp protease adapter protein ClpS
LTNLVHHTGSAVVEITSKERAELYVDQVKSLARPRGFPLTATIEPD